MIISVSRRTDIPAYFAPWFFERIHAGYAMVRNPRNPQAIKRISLLPEDVDGFVFWTKNPMPMLSSLERISQYAYYFQCTITPYGKEVEPFIPSKRDIVLPAVLRLSQIIGAHRVFWRYDPIFLSKTYSRAYHYQCFERIAQRLEGKISSCTISFLDIYRNTKRNAAALGFEPMRPQDLLEMSGKLAGTAAKYGIILRACAEEADLSAAGVGRAGCVDAALLSAVSGRNISAKKDRNQRGFCGCDQSVDLGAYNTCPGGCLYCYANYSPSLIRKRRGLCDPGSPFLVGTPDARPL